MPLAGCHLSHYRTHVISQAGALFVMDDTRWDHGLKVTGEGEGLTGHAGAVLLRKLADQAGLTGALGAALARAGKFPLIDRGVGLVSMAVAIALRATSMNDIALLAHHEPVFGAPPSGTTVRRTLELADPRTLDKIARVRAAVRGHVWSLNCATPAGFPWLAIAGRLVYLRKARSRYLWCCPRLAVITLDRPPRRARGGHAHGSRRPPSPRAGLAR